MRPQALLTVVLTVIAIPVAYRAFVTVSAPPFQPIAPVPAVVKKPEIEVLPMKIRRLDSRPRLHVPGREFVPPLPVG
jgi:hypothetical protein